MRKVKRIKDEMIDINDPQFNPEVSDPVETAAAVVEAICPDMEITEIDPEGGVYLPRPITPEEGAKITEYLGIGVPMQCYNMPSYLPVVANLHNVEDGATSILVDGKTLDVLDSLEIGECCSDKEAVRKISQKSGLKPIDYTVYMDPSGSYMWIHTEFTDEDWNPEPNQEEWLYLCNTGVAFKIKPGQFIADSKVADEFKEGDVYNDGEYQGVIKAVNADSITIESQNEDGDVVDINLPINDSSDLEQFVMNLIVRKKANCPVTKNKYEIKSNTLFVNGEKKEKLPADITEAVKRLKEIIKKAKPIKDSASRQFSDEDIDDLLAYGSVTVEEGEYSPQDIASEMEIELASWQDPGETPLVLGSYSNGDGTATIYVEDF